MKDKYKRPINYMRISITDRCNLRCRYCMPQGIEKVPMSRIMTYEQILETAEAAAAEGITRFKVTGGEPLCRLGCTNFIRELKRVPGVEQVTLTTNGVLLGDRLRELEAAGVDGINISLDTLDPVRYKEITGSDRLEQVLDSLHAAVCTGIPVKVNCVVMDPKTDEDRMALIRLAENEPVDVRFISMMPIGMGKDFSIVSGEEILRAIEDRYPCVEKEHTVHGNGPAVYYHIAGFRGSIGFIDAVHHKFCEGCNRIRLTSMGKLKPCLCSGESIDLMPVWEEAGSPAVRRAGSGERTSRSADEKDCCGGEVMISAERFSRAARQRQLREAVREAVRRKPEHHDMEKAVPVAEKALMSSIGG